MVDKKNNSKNSSFPLDDGRYYKAIIFQHKSVTSLDSIIDRIQSILYDFGDQKTYDLYYKTESSKTLKENPFLVNSSLIRTRIVHAKQLWNPNDESQLNKIKLTDNKYVYPIYLSSFDNKYYIIAFPFSQIFEEIKKLIEANTSTLEYSILDLNQIVRSLFDNPEGFQHIQLTKLSIEPKNYKEEPYVKNIIISVNQRNGLNSEKTIVGSLNKSKLCQSLYKKQFNTKKIRITYNNFSGNKFSIESDALGSITFYMGQGEKKFSDIFFLLDNLIKYNWLNRSIIPPIQG